MRQILKFLLPFTVAVSLAGTACAAAMAEPSGPVILSISGEIEQTNSDGAAQFDRAMLEKIGWKTIESYSTWTDGPTKFSGVPLADVLAFVGATGDELLATALNDYSVTIPVTDAEEYNVLLVLEINGEPMRIRDKGPLWVVYPRTEEQAADPALDDKMIWQLKSIKVTD